MRSNSSFAETFLTRFDVKVERIQTSDEKRADLLAHLDGTVTLIEEKIKLDDPASEVERREMLEVGEIHATHIPLTPNNRLSGITHEAAKQLLSTACAVQQDFRVVWFTAAGRHYEAKYEQYIATLYGTSSIVELSRWDRRTCYFFRNSDFFRYRDNLDGAVVAQTDGRQLSAMLCLNPLSCRYSEFKVSAFTTLFRDGVLDPSSEEALGRALIADGDVDRSKPDQVLAYLQNKYGTQPLMNMDVHVGVGVSAQG